LETLIITIPKRLVEEASRRGLDLEEFILSILAEKLNLDPEELSEARLELAERFLEEARGLAEKGDPVQASEKLYKAAEEAVKTLSILHGIPEALEARRRGRWTTPLLFDAVERLSQMLKPEVRDWWDHAWLLHVEGFHEARLKAEHVKARIQYIESLVKLAREELAKKKRGPGKS
jgi:hypothetical protein